MVLPFLFPSCDYLGTIRPFANFSISSSYIKTLANRVDTVSSGLEEIGTSADRPSPG